MTKREIRIKIQDLLDECKGKDCKYISVSNASIYVCPKCPIGQRIQELGKKLDPKLATRRKGDSRPKTLKNTWTEEEIQFVVQNKGKLTYQEMGTILGRTADAVKSKFYKVREMRMLEESKKSPMC